MNANDPNIALLERAADLLGDALLQQLVFVGGAVAGLLITDPAMPEIRPTQDVDVICRVIARADYQQLGMQLRKRGFEEDTRPGAPLWPLPRTHRPILDKLTPTCFAYACCVCPLPRNPANTTAISSRLRRRHFLFPSFSSSIPALSQFHAGLSSRPN